MTNEALRIKGGVGFAGCGWVIVVHVWHSTDAEGEPDEEYRLPNLYPDMATALAVYDERVRPMLTQFAAAASKMRGVSIVRWLSMETG